MVDSSAQTEEPNKFLRFLWSGPVNISPYRWQLSWSFLTHLLKAVARQHHREPAQNIQPFIPPDAVVFDLGAHAGQHTKLFARLASRGQVYAFEPGAYARSILRIAIWLHRLKNVVVLPVAVGSAYGMHTFTTPIKRARSVGFGLSHLGQPDRRWDAVTQETVMTVALDEIVPALGLKRLDFIKADIEGWEVQMVIGAYKTLNKFRPALTLELTKEGLARANNRPEEAFELLARIGYRGFDISPTRHLVPVETPSEGEFLFLPSRDGNVG